jgi:hypothetical protein
MDSNEGISSPMKNKPMKKLLSLDGGGVKGISSLRILDNIMNEVRREEIEKGICTSTEERLPVDYFDLAAGTSTGGLIALMLFRLRMTTTEAIKAFNELAADVFSPTIFGLHLYKLGIVGYYIGNLCIKVKSVFKSEYPNEPLKKAIDKVVAKYGNDESKEGDALLVHPNTGGPGGPGRMFMCATLADKGESILLRSYPTPRDALPVTSGARKKTSEEIDDTAIETALVEDISIKTAALATSAAPIYLPEVTWRGLRFWDGGLLNNNPIDQLWVARYDLVGESDPAPEVSLVLSLGTSWTTQRPKSIFRVIETLASFITNTEAKNRDFRREINRINSRLPEEAKTEYIRFNTPTKDKEFNLDEYRRMDELDKLTVKYLKGSTEAEDIKKCVRLLIA